MNAQARGKAARVEARDDGDERYEVERFVGHDHRRIGGVKQLFWLVKWAWDLKTMPFPPDNTWEPAVQLAEDLEMYDDLRRQYIRDTCVDEDDV